MTKQYLELGKITNLHGIRGEVRAVSWGDNIESLLGYETVYVGKAHRPFTVEAARVHKNFALFKFAGIDTPEKAQMLKGEIIYMVREKMNPLPEGRYYIVDLIGVLAFLDNGEALGKVKDVITTGANDVFIIEGEEKEYLIPFIPSCVKDVDMENKKITIVPIEGLLDL
jgi:16S rRNA processing protein RimM